MQARHLISIAALSAASIASINSFAGSSPFGIHAYIGAGFGPSGFFSSVGRPNSRNYAVGGTLGSTYAGISYTFHNNFLIATEGFYDWRSTTLKDTADFTPTFYEKFNRSYGVRILPGYQLDSYKSIHAILGYTRMPLRFSFGNTRFNTKLNAFQFGVGTDYNLTKYLSARLDLMYLKSWQHRNFTLSSNNFRTNVSGIDALLSLYVKL